MARGGRGVGQVAEHGAALEAAGFADGLGAVLWRKVSLGTQTDAGDRFVERILTIRATCQLNQQPLHGYLTDVHHARLAGTGIPLPHGVAQIAA